MCGSTIYTVDKLLVPPVGNLFQMLSNNPAYSRFLDLVKAANLSEAVNQPARTLIVPRNQAFDNLEEEVMDHALKILFICCRFWLGWRMNPVLPKRRSSAIC